MADVNIFQIMDVMFENATNTFVVTKAASLIAAIKPLAVTATGLFLTLYGYMVMAGRVQEPFKDFLLKSIKIILIATFALNAPFYISSVVDTLNGLEDGLVSALGGNTNIFAQLDSTLNKGFDLMDQALDQSDNADWADFGSIIAWHLIAFIVIGSTLVLVLVGGMVILVASALLKVLFAIGPLFIMCLMWPATAKFFDSWFSQVITFTLKIVFVALVLTLANEMFSRVITPINLNNNNSPWPIALSVLIAGYLNYRLVLEVSSMAASLAGGIAASTLGFGQMVSAVGAPKRALSSAGRTLNPQSTRRDLESGMVATRSRLAHIASGNTVLNPAYRQHLSKNIGKNWGHNKGGTAKKTK